MPIRIKEEDLLIRAFEFKDIEDVVAIFQAPKCIHGTLQLPYQSTDEIREKLKSPGKNIHRLSAYLKPDKKVVGFLGIHLHTGRISHSANLGLFVLDQYQGIGIGQKLIEAAVEIADKWLNLTRLDLFVYTDNISAVKLYEKFGFVIEGTAKKYAFRDGKFIDAYLMARIRKTQL